MNSVNTPEEIEQASKQVINSLYGDDVSDFRVNETFNIKEERFTDRFDVQVNFMQNDLKHTVDLEIEKETGRVVKALLLDAMKPL